ncbi:MAG: hypothetical protein ACHQX1_03005, partial [Candidatus Micrarchaeales archaeon]
AATGLRGIRYYLETPSKSITFLEINKKVYGSLKKNVASNKIKAKTLNKSIQEFTNNTREKFDIIDLDPFGGITPYIYDLMKVSKGGTHLLITATDMAVLCGADYKACLKLYDARPLHNELCKEVGLRILIGYVARIAAQFNFGVEVLLSFSYMHYMRVFLKLNHGSDRSVESIKGLGYAYYCNNCSYRHLKASIFPTMTECPNCGKGLEIGGKLWAGSLQDKKVIEPMLFDMSEEFPRKAYRKESVGFLRSILGEIDVPLYYSIPSLTKKMKIGSVSDIKTMELLESKGFEASKTHLEKASLRTNATLKEIKQSIKTVSKGY